jgi:hypothetical protein
MKEIKLTKGLFTKVDDKDFEWLNQFRWCCDANGYVVRHEQKSEYGLNPRKMIKMHKFILKPSEGKMTDHINQDKLDNRRINLRVVDNHTNQRNSKIGIRNKSGFKGVYFDKKYKRWCARATVYGKRVFGGGFFNLLDAHKSYQNLIQIYG